MYKGTLPAGIWHCCPSSPTSTQTQTPSSQSAPRAHGVVGRSQSNIQLDVKGTAHNTVFRVAIPLKAVVQILIVPKLMTMIVMEMMAMMMTDPAHVVADRPHLGDCKKNLQLTHSLSPLLLLLNWEQSTRSWVFHSL